jgi:F-type H+-transporting ATPase subunit delta
MFPFRIASIYAQSLFELVAKEQLEDSLNQLEQIVQLVTQTKIWYFFSSPQIDIQEKERLLAKVFKEKVNQKILLFLNALLEKGRFKYLPNILSIYRKLVINSLGKQDALLITPVLIDEQQTQKLKEHLNKTYHKEFIIHNELNSQMLGGSILIFGHKMLDGSLRTKLKKLEKDLLSINV